MRELPTGIVTFVFTDIEGSTRLLERLGDDAYDRVLSDHHHILREAITAHAGVEVGTEGDAFFVVFANADDAVAATLAAQAALVHHSWIDGADVRVRMGLHTGVGRRGVNDYVGLAVHQAARIAAAAHGGQVLLSVETRQSLVTTPAGATVQSLGRHRLKDLGSAIELYQLCHSELEADFPPPRSLERVMHNLPVQPSSFLGRTEELETGARLLNAARLLTVTGPGGIGKTRLSYQLAADCLDTAPDGVWVVELATVSDSARVPTVTAAVMGLRDEPGRTATDVIVGHLRNRYALVVLDNCEHVIDAAADLADSLLRGCERVRVIATTREPLRIAGESVWALNPLSIPTSAGLPVEALASTDAVRLFCERAAETDAGFALTPENAADIVAICSRLEGMPLALELAAAWVRSLSAAQIASRLGQSLDLLTKGARKADERQASLRGTIAWSYDLLSADEKRLFARMAVFEGGWTLDAAEQVCSGPGVAATEVMRLLGALVDKSLVAPSEPADGTTRFRFLVTIREFALERLAEPGEVDAVADLHAAWCEGLAQRGSDATKGSLEEARAFDLLEADHPNLLAALEHLHTTGRARDQARLALSLRDFWDLRGHWRLSQRELSRCLDASQIDQTLRSQLLGGLGGAAASLGDFSEARARYDEALAIARALSDHRAEAAWVGGLGDIAWARSDYPEARARFGEARAIARTVGHRRLEARWGGGLGDVAWILRDHAEARARYDEALAIAREVGDRRWEGRWGGSLGDVAYLFGDYPEARVRYGEALEIARALRDRWLESVWVGSIAWVDLNVGDFSKARAGLDEALAMARSLGDRSSQSNWLQGLGDVAKAVADYPTALARYHEVLDNARELGDRLWEGYAVAGLAGVALALGERRDARARYSEALAIASELGTHWIWLLEDCARLLESATEFEASVRLLGAADGFRRIDNMRRPLPHQTEFGATVEKCRAGLGEEAFSNAWKHGAEMDWAAALASAIELVRIVDA